MTPSEMHTHTHTTERARVYAHGHAHTNYTWWQWRGYFFPYTHFLLSFLPDYSLLSSFGDVVEMYVGITILFLFITILYS